MPLSPSTNAVFVAQSSFGRVQCGNCILPTATPICWRCEHPSVIGPLKCEHAQREKELSLLIILEYLLFVTLLMRLYSFSPHASQRYLVKVWWSCTISQFLPLLTQGKEALCQLLESFPFLQGIVTSAVYRTSWLFPNGLLRPRGFGNELTFTSKRLLHQVPTLIFQYIKFVCCAKQ